MEIFFIIILKDLLIILSKWKIHYFNIIFINNLSFIYKFTLYRSNYVLSHIKSIYLGFMKCHLNDPILRNGELFVITTHLLWNKIHLFIQVPCIYNTHSSAFVDGVGFY